MLNVKQRGIKYHFLSLWYDSFGDWTSVSPTIGERSNHYIYIYIYIYIIIITYYRLLSMYLSPLLMIIILRFLVLYGISRQPLFAYLFVFAFRLKHRADFHSPGFTLTPFLNSALPLPPRPSMLPLKSNRRRWTGRGRWDGWVREKGNE